MQSAAALSYANAVAHLAEHGVLAIEVRLPVERDEELAAVGVLVHRWHSRTLCL